MGKHVRHDGGHEGGATARSLDASLPECLSGLVSPEVWAESNDRVEEKLQDRSRRETMKRLYMEALADHLEREAKNARNAAVEDASGGLPRRAA